jgi:hypothetical protein
MLRLGCDGYDAVTRAAVEAIQWQLAQQLLALGVSVILESGFWSRQDGLRSGLGPPSLEQTRSSSSLTFHR